MSKSVIGSLVVLVLLSVQGQMAMAGMDEALDAYETGKYAAALKEFTRLAKKGNSDAQFYLGWMYRKGQGVAQDDKEAVKWYRRAADQGDADAQFKLAWMYNNGHGVATDYKEAVKWYRRAANQGNADAQKGLGYLYVQGQGVTRDDKQAVAWYRLAADQGNTDAQTNLGWMYDHGRGVPASRVVAYALYDLSAEGDPSSENNATANRTSLAKSMTKQEMEAAQALSQELAKPGNLTKALDRYVGSVGQDQ